MQSLVIQLLIIVSCLFPTAACARQTEPVEFSAMTWNIWRGGREDGEVIGPQRVIEVIRNSGVDLVAMQETYGSGELISEALGFHVLPRDRNVSIHSRFPIVEDISVFEPFKCVGALIELPNKARVAFYSIWLPYDADIWKEGTRDVSDVASMLAATRASASDLETLLSAIADRLDDPKYAQIPIIIAGDFNSMSHLDYVAVARDQYEVVVNWPTSQHMFKHGFRDAYREHHPDINRLRDRTWTPRFPSQQQDRIDFIYHKGHGLESVSATNIDQHDVQFPSDHAAVVAGFRFDPDAKPITNVAYRVVSYNIRHGRGMDNTIDLQRIAEVLEPLAPDLVGLQEVDLRVTRSEEVNQAAALGRALGMHAAFGSFMELQGGHYGMAILSRHPLRNVHSIGLPRGNEPRIALAAEIQLPSGDAIMAINVHFDWVRDDEYRFAQATALAEYLRELKMPYVLLGDFNDRPGSRTMDLFQTMAVEAAKPADQRFTFPSVGPDREIDFIFAAPAARWKISTARVIAEEEASDHRPVFAEITFQTHAD